MGDEPPKLRIEIDTARPLKGRDVARLIERLIIAFEIFEASTVASREERSVLRMTTAYTGSLVLELTALALSGASVAFSFEECRERMVRFVRRLKKSSEALKGQDVGARTRANDAFIESAMGTLLSGDATLIVVLVHGDNDEPFALNRRDAGQIRDATVPRERGATTLARAEGDWVSKGEMNPDARVEWQKGDDLPAQVYFVDRWMAFVGGLGVSLPIVNDRIMSGCDWGQKYEVTGHVLRSEHGDAYQIMEVGESRPIRD